MSSVPLLHQLTDALEVAVAATQKLDVFDLAVLQIEVDHLRAGALGLVLVHNDSSFLFILSNQQALPKPAPPFCRGHTLSLLEGSI